MGHPASPRPAISGAAIGRAPHTREMKAPYAMSKEPRFPQLTLGQLNDKQNPLAEQIMKVSRVGLGGPYNPLLRSPVLGQKMFDLLHYLRWQTSVPLKLNELAILVVGVDAIPFHDGSQARGDIDPISSQVFAEIVHHLLNTA